MRSLARYAGQHGVIRLASRRAARSGDLHAGFMHTADYRVDPFPYYEQVRARGPLVRGRLVSVTASYDVASAVLRSDDFRAGPDEDVLPGGLRRIVQWAREPEVLGPIDPPSLLVIEPPDHTRMRKFVSKVFTARAVEALRPQVQAIADGLLDRMAGRDEVDLVEHYASRLPVAVISGVLGVPERDHDLVLRFGHLAAPSLDVGLSWRQFREVEGAVRGFQTWLGHHLERLRREPGDDLLSQLVQLDELTDVELRATAGLVLAAGFETTVNLLGSATVLLLQDRDQLTQLRTDPSLWPTAVDEALRLEGPVQLTGRFATRDTEVAGHAMRRGAIVVTYLGGANRDPAVFADPARFDVHRANARDHLTFSAGRHFCLGAALARLEGEIGLRSLFERFPDLALAGAGVRRQTRVLRGWESLPVRTGVLARA